MRQILNKQTSVVEILQDAILSGTLAPGMELKQNELAETLEVSRMPIREALFILEYQGLAERLPNNHVRVADLSDSAFEDIFQMAEQEEQKILLAEDTSHIPEEEMSFHRFLYHQAHSALTERTLKTVTEIYIRFAIGKAVSEKENGKRQELLVLVCQYAKEKNKMLLIESLNQYYQCLRSIVSNQKESI